MNARNAMRRMLRPVGAVVLLGALTLVLSGCDNHRGHRSVRYDNDGGYYGDVRAYPVRRAYAPAPVIVVPDHRGRPPVHGNRGPGRHDRH